MTLNDIGKGGNKQAPCCFITRAVPVPMHPQKHCGRTPSMSLSLRKLTLAVALSLTVSAHKATIAAPSIGITQQQTVATSRGHAPRAASIAYSLRSRGIPDSLTVMLVSAMPVVELRGGIPLGHYLGMAPLQTLALAIVGNLAPIIPTMLMLRIAWVRSKASRLLERARKAADGVSNAQSRVTALALFVGVPLPGTGAWTGCLIAFLLGMRTDVAFGALAVGVVMAGIIVSALCVLGWIGAAMAGCVLLGGGAVTLYRTTAVAANEEDEEEGDRRGEGGASPKMESA